MLTEQEIRKKIENFKQREKKSACKKIRIKTDTALEIYRIIDSIQKSPPHVPVQFKNIDKKIDVSYRTVVRGFNILLKSKVLEHDKKNKQWSISEYKEKRKQCLLEQKRLTVIYARKLEKTLEFAKQNMKALKKKNLDLELLVEIAKPYPDLKLLVEMAKPYLDNLRYCDSDEDWELLIKWFMKMQENKHFHGEAEAQEQDYKENADGHQTQNTPHMAQAEEFCCYCRHQGGPTPIAKAPDCGK